MAIGAVLHRDSPYDAVVFSATKYAGQKMSLSELPEGSVIGTSSLRRVAQIKRAYPHLKVCHGIVFLTLPYISLSVQQQPLQS